MKNRNFTNVTVLTPDGKENILDNISPDARKDIEWVVIENTLYGFKFLLHKKELANARYEDQLAAAAAFTEGGRTGNRIEWITLYNAVHTAGLNNVLNEIGGDPIGLKLYWTEEMDEDQSSPAIAWYFSGTYGYLTANYARYGSFASRVLRAL